MLKRSTSLEPFWTMICSWRLGRLSRLMVSFIVFPGCLIVWPFSDQVFPRLRFTNGQTSSKIPLPAHYLGAREACGQDFQKQEADSQRPSRRSWLLHVVLAADSKTELGNQPQEAKEPHSGLDILLHG